MARRRNTLKSKRKTSRKNKTKSRGRVAKGGSYGAIPFPQSTQSPASVYNEDPSRHAISASNQPDMLKGGRKKRQAKAKLQKGGTFHQSLLNGVSSLSQLSNAGVSQNGIHHPPIMTGLGGISSIGNNMILGPQQYNLTSTNPPLA